ncbi:MAG: nucleotidyltransferase domain-containing protein [Candidatus Aminicenantes bacterium]|nr:nucleotidyltransferase domain-containing protein [Candidatus Aminicenantes bacterium]
MKKDLWIKRFEKEILPILLFEFNPEMVIIFGSRIKRTANEESDIDIIIISDYFKDTPFIKRMAQVLRKARFEKHIDYICYTYAEYERLKDRSTILVEALENGLRVA